MKDAVDPTVEYVTKDELTTMLEISQTLNSSLDMEEILDHVLNLSVELVQAQASSIWLMDDETQKLYVVSATGVRSREIKQIQVELGEGIVGWVAKYGKPFSTPDARQESAHKREIAEAVGYESKSILCVPMRCKDRVVGAIEVINKIGNPEFTQKDMDILWLFANYAGVAVENARLYGMVMRENSELRRELGGVHKTDPRELMGKSSKISELLNVAKRVAGTNATILLRGESGSGKELVAHAIHQASQRADKPFIAVNCGALPDTLLETELFGHEKGAFTGAISRKLGRFELANGGTIFLDEIGDTSLPMQVKMMRVLQEKEFERVGGTRKLTVDVRVIAATNQNLEEKMKQGTFREDLYYRLNVITIHVPPLRERVVDIPILAEHFLRRYSFETNRKIKDFTDDAINAIIEYGWPGNVRELENAIEHAVILSSDDIIQLEDLPRHIYQKAEEDTSYTMSLEDAQKGFKRELILKALQQTNGNRTQAAKLLKIQRTYLSRLIKELEINA